MQPWQRNARRITASVSRSGLILASALRRELGWVPACLVGDPVAEPVPVSVELTEGEAAEIFRPGAVPGSMGLF